MGYSEDIIAISLAVGDGTQRMISAAGGPSMTCTYFFFAVEPSA
jgi:hypothetical protein